MRLLLCLVFESVFFVFLVREQWVLGIVAGDLA